MTTLRERAARAAYEEYFAGLIGCCEPAWDELPPEHQERLMRAQDAATAVVREHLSEQGRRMPPAIEDILADAQLGRRCGCSGCDDAAANTIDDAWHAMLAAAFEGKA